MTVEMALLAVFLALISSVVLAFCVPIWASLSIALAAVVLVGIGGGALLLKASIAAALIGGVVWLVRALLHRRRLKRMQAEVIVLAIPQAGTSARPQESQPRTERLAA